MVSIPSDKIHTHSIKHEAGGIVTITVQLVGSDQDPELLEIRRQLTEAWRGHVRRLRPGAQWDVDQGDDLG